MGAKKGVKKATFKVVPIDDTRKVSFSITFTVNDKKETREVKSRADLFATVRALEMLNVSPDTILRSVSQNVKVEAPKVG